MSDTQDNSNAYFVLLPSEGKTISVGPNRITYKMGGANTDDAFSVIEYSVGPGFEAPAALHFHTKESWAGYILEGTLAFQLGEQEMTLSAGSFLYVPKGLPFKWWNPADKPAKYLAFYFPAGFEQYFEEISGILKSLPPGPVDGSKLTPLVLPLWGKFGIGVKDSETEK